MKAISGKRKALSARKTADNRAILSYVSDKRVRLTAPKSPSSVIKKTPARFPTAFFASSIVKEVFITSLLCFSQRKRISFSVFAETSQLSKTPPSLFPEIPALTASNPISSFPALLQRQTVLSVLFIRRQLLFNQIINFIGNAAFQRAFKPLALFRRLKAFYIAADICASPRFFSRIIKRNRAFFVPYHPQGAFFSYHFTAGNALAKRNFLFGHIFTPLVRPRLQPFPRASPQEALPRNPRG